MADDRHYFNQPSQQSSLKLAYPTAKTLVTPSRPRPESTLRVEFSDIDEVYVSGQFNRWTIPGHRMSRVSDSSWEAVIELGDGPVSIGCFGLVDGRIAKKRFYVVKKSDHPEMTSGGDAPLEHSRASVSSNKE